MKNETIPPVIGSDQEGQLAQQAQREHDEARRAYIAERLAERRRFTRLLVLIGLAHVITVATFMIWGALSR